MNIKNLKEQRETLMKYVIMKININDLHGAIDGLMDIREIDAQIILLQELDNE